MAAANGAGGRGGAAAPASARRSRRRAWCTRARERSSRQHAMDLGTTAATTRVTRVASPGVRLLLGVWMERATALDSVQAPSGPSVPTLCLASGSVTSRTVHDGAGDRGGGRWPHVYRPVRPPIPTARCGRPGVGAGRSGRWGPAPADGATSQPPAWATQRLRRAAGRGTAHADRTRAPVSGNGWGHSGSTGTRGLGKTPTQRRTGCGARRGDERESGKKENRKRKKKQTTDEYNTQSGDGGWWGRRARVTGKTSW